MRDLSFFLCFILVFLCGFSITSWSLLSSAGQVNWIYNDDGKLLNITISLDKQNTWTWQLIRDIAQYGVWKVFGQVDPIGSLSNIVFSLSYSMFSLCKRWNWFVFKYCFYSGDYICGYCQYIAFECSHCSFQVSTLTNMIQQIPRSSVLR